MFRVTSRRSLLRRPTGVGGAGNFRATLLLIVVLITSGLAATSCESTTADRKNLMAMVNQARTASGLAPLATRCVGSAIATVHAAYMESAEHRSNILDPKFSQLGVAAVWGSCSDGTRRVFTVEEFTSG